MNATAYWLRRWVLGIVVLLFICEAAPAQWKRVTQNHTDVELYSVYFVSDTHGWVVGSNVILQTTNGGQSWDMREFPQVHRFMSVCFTDPNTGWVGGAGVTNATASLRTTNGGVDWIETPIKSSKSIRDIEFVDSDHGWMLMDSNAILRTTDSGENWTEHEILPILPALPVVTDMHFIDADHGWACGGSNGFIRHTEDGGRTWATQANFANTVMTSINVNDNGVGWSVGNDWTIYHTSDGGSRWMRQKNMRIPASDVYNSICMIDDQIGWIGGEGFLLGSRDGGLSWRADSISYSATSVTDIFFLNSQRGWAVGRFGMIFEYIDPNGGEVYMNGNAYVDTDDDCAAAAEDLPLAHRVIEISPGPEYTLTRDHGSFATRLDPGNYTVEAILPEGWSQPCPDNSYNIALTNPDDTASGINFVQEPLVLCEKLHVDIGNSRLRPGFEVHYNIYYENIGTLPFTGTLSVAFDPALEFIAAYPPYMHRDSAVIEWDISNAAIGSFAFLDVIMRVPPDVELLGREVCTEVEATPRPFDTYGEPTHAEFCDIVRGSYDPNAIISFPRGEGIEGIITPEDTVLEYTIYFQNTGTDTAFTVRLLDTLPPLLDIPSLQFGASSHPYEVELSGTGVLKFTFDNILLPDSNVNEQASHGFVKYRARIHPHTPLETPIRNRAEIYFDYNPPVTTNTVSNQIRQETVSVGDDPSEYAVEVYPNPASDLLLINAGDVGIRTATLINALGREVATYNFGPSAQRRIDLTQFSTGMYTLRLETAHGVLTRSLAIAR